MRWRCKDGRVLELAEIETDHLKNIVHYLRSKGAVTPDEYIDCLGYACSSSTPDGAAMAAEQELEGMKPMAGLEKLEAELERRLKNET